MAKLWLTLALGLCVNVVSATEDSKSPRDSEKAAAADARQAEQDNKIAEFTKKAAQARRAADAAQQAAEAQMKAAEAAVNQLSEAKKAAEASRTQRAGSDAPQLEQVRQQIEMMIRKATELAEQGRGEESAKICEQAQQLLQHVAASRRDERAGPELPRPEQVRQQVEMMIRKATELAEQGHAEEAAKIREQAQQLLQHADPSRRAERTGADATRQTAERIRHIREAVEHLRAAGLNDLADELMKMTEQITR